MENKSVISATQVLAPAVSEIRSLLDASRKNVAQQVNQELLSTYWKIGEIIVRYEQNDSVRAAYGEKTLPQLSKTGMVSVFDPKPPLTSRSRYSFRACASGTLVKYSNPIRLHS